MTPSSFSDDKHSTENDNCLTLVSLPKKWQDFDTKKDSTHRIVNAEYFEAFLNEATIDVENDFKEENRKSTSNTGIPFDTIVAIDKSDPHGLIVSLDLDLSWVETREEEQNGPEKYLRDISIHLNREATEVAHRAFQRLEISVSKKLPFKSKKKKRRKKRVAATLENSKNPPVAGKADESLSRLFQKDNFVNNGSNNNKDINTEEITTIELCHQLESMPASRIGFDLSTPLDDEMNAENNSPAPSHTARFHCRVQSNPPVILATHTFESFRSKLFVGIPVVLQTTLLHATRAEVSWFIVNDNHENGEQAEELVLHNSPSFVPKARYIGKRLTVVVRPVRETNTNSIVHGKSEAYTFCNFIEELPRMPIVSPLRDDFVKGTQNSDQNSRGTLRVCTYNILADLYVSRKGNGQDVPTTYPHVHYKHVEKTRRIPMIVGELMAYQADIICLQEVDGSAYDTFLQPVFLALGYDGYYSNKASSQREGCALFWSRSLLEVEKSLSFEVRDLFRSPLSKDEKIEQEWESMRDIYRLLDSHEELRTVVTEKLGQILQIATLKLKDPSEGQPKEIMVANTHLFWHPMADHIRAMQVYVVAKKIDEVRRENSGGDQKENNSPQRPFLLCGDLNSDPLSGASQLLSSRSLAPDQHNCWKYLHRYKWDVDNDDLGEMVEGGTTAEERRIEARDEKNNQSIKLLSTTTGTKSSTVAPPYIKLSDFFPIVQSGCKENPPFTNFSLDFVDTLDYVLASKASASEMFGFEPKRSAAMPSILDVKEFISMPNEFMPSDHVSIVCDFDLCRYN
eukprot:CAMPEP_0168172304 /NCGR_PEP_ID=MMETSP0139_2-20121125/5167_1 /TAXON_ID=44445 /ORGANISM="Pseudo-nitzschia australis, Strain 10249 10 AB" /LENGTH=795 /DNA_ID=CAMNT_0008089915 /DNA_START=20 /DNA_END=2407 /DNA_ORIENTATION=+